LDLRKLARQRQRPTAELLQLFALEGFLARLPLSPLSNHLVLKGGVLLSAFDARRPTRDVDLAATGISNNPESVGRVIRDVLAVELKDGLEFDLSKSRSQTIRDGDEYSGVRVDVPCKLASAKVDFHVDVNVGDPILPPPTIVQIPRLLGGESLRVSGYSVSMVLAEKVVTAIQRGTANTRWRDFADISTLSRGQTLVAAELLQSIDAVAQHRSVVLRPLAQVLEGFGESGQPGWAAWRRRTQADEGLPDSFAPLLEEIDSFVDPLLIREVSGGEWNPGSMTWRT
jgi:predicted nucleotidyltransferase component of viral defense system